PCSPLEARRPSSGPITSTPRSRSVVRLAWVAACSYMWLFIAGATSTGQPAASAHAPSMSSAIPAASLAIVLAEAGAIRYTSARAGAPFARRSSAVVVGDLPRGYLLEGDREVVFRGRLDHRRRELVEGALAEVVVVAVDLARALRRDDHARVVGVDVLQQPVDSRRDHLRLPFPCGR